MKWDVYNLFWLDPLVPRIKATLKGVSRNNINVYDNDTDLFPAYILYPSLLTPAIVVGSEPLEIILLVRGDIKQILSPEIVNVRLKYSLGINPWKTYSDEELFPILSDGDIVVTKISDSLPEDGKVRTDQKFWGCIDKRAIQKLKVEGTSNWGSRLLYSVKIKNTCIRERRSWDWEFNREKDKNVPNEHQDRFIRKVLSGLHNRRANVNGEYCFKIGDHDVQVGEVDFANPIQSYHPVFYRETLSYANFGHMSDIHISSRQHVLAKNKARVIDYWIQKDGIKNEEDLDVSPAVGSFVNVSSRNVKQLLDELGHDDVVDCLLVGGDLIDFIQNVGPRDESGKQGFPKSMKVLDIWNLVALDARYEERYLPFVDLVSFYSLIMYFYRTYQKPAFVISGNHDAYYYPFGISPRVKLLQGGLDPTEKIDPVKLVQEGKPRVAGGPSEEGRLANEGIPADHNMTIYEALLSFGDTYWDIRAPVGLLRRHTMIMPEHFTWFYTVLTPFSDFAVVFPNQVLVGLGWGGGEVVVDFPGTNHGLGHLPRSEDAISDGQLEVLRKATQSEKKVILMTHFTFVSFKDDKSFDYDQEGEVWAAQRYTPSDWGTFERNRTVYKAYFGEKTNVQCVVTGHSHRRALYEVLKNIEFQLPVATGRGMGAVGYTRIPGLKVKIHDPSLWRGDIKEPAIIVSDSGGPHPRYNRAGEFKAWGSDRPSATSVRFDEKDGTIKAVAIHQVGHKPRLAVALEYLDLVAEESVINQFATPWISVLDGRNQPKYTFTIQLSDESKNKLSLRVEKVRLYVFQGTWYRIELVLDHSSGNWTLLENDIETFRDHFVQNQGRRKFLALQFSTSDRQLKNQYDCNGSGVAASWWTYECEVDIEYPPGQFLSSRYVINRYQGEKGLTMTKAISYQGKPDFDGLKDWYSQHSRNI